MANFLSRLFGKKAPRNLTVMDLLVLFAQFSDLPASGREGFLRTNPEILNPSVVDYALRAALLREPEDRRRIASAALYISTRLNDKERQAEAQKILRDG